MVNKIIKQHFQYVANGCVHVCACGSGNSRSVNKVNKQNVYNEIRLLLVTFTFCPIYITVLPNIDTYCARLVSTFLACCVCSIYSFQSCICLSEYAYILVLFICTFSVANLHITKSPYSAIGHFVSNPMTFFGNCLGCFCLALHKIGNMGQTFV